MRPSSLAISARLVGDVALAIAYLLAFVADEAAEAPGLDGDALGDDLLHVAFGLEVVEDAGAVGLPLGLALEGGDDGGDGVDAELGGVEAGDGFAFVGLWSVRIWCHGWRIAGCGGDLKGVDGTGADGSSFFVFEFGLRDDSRIGLQLRRGR